MTTYYPTLLSRLVRDFELEATTFQGELTIHRQPLSRRIEKWRRVEVLGHGGYGVVWLEHRVASDDAAETVCRAVKVVRSHNWKSVDYFRELEALAKFSLDTYSDFFVKFLGWYHNPKSGDLHIAMEYCQHGDLKKHLAQNGGKLSEGEVKDIASQVLAGVVMMHRAGFTNRDIKPANILIKSKPPGNWCVKICDFGLSKRVQGGFESAATTTVRGTPDFMPPETLGFTQRPGEIPQKIDWFMVDMWCLGETIFQALMGKPVFETLADVGRYFDGNQNFPVRELHRVNASTQAESFIASLMKAQPRQRMTSEEAIKHRWITDMALEEPIRVPVAPKSAAYRSGTPDQHPYPRTRPPGDQLTEASGQWTTTMISPYRPRSPKHQGRGRRQGGLHPRYYYSHSLKGTPGAKQGRRPYSTPSRSMYYPSAPYPGYLVGNSSPNYYPQPTFAQTQVPVVSRPPETDSRIYSRLLGLPDNRSQAPSYPSLAARVPSPPASRAPPGPRSAACSLICASPAFLVLKEHHPFLS